MHWLSREVTPLKGELIDGQSDPNRPQYTLDNTAPPGRQGDQNDGDSDVFEIARCRKHNVDETVTSRKHRDMTHRYFTQIQYVRPLLHVNTVTCQTVTSRKHNNMTDRYFT